LKAVGLLYFYFALLFLNNSKDEIKLCNAYWIFSGKSGTLKSAAHFPLPETGSTNPNYHP
jgi:hypothetical protein